MALGIIWAPKVENVECPTSRWQSTIIPWIQAFWQFSLAYGRYVSRSPVIPTPRRFSQNKRVDRRGDRCKFTSR